MKLSNNLIFVIGIILFLFILYAVSQVLFFIALPIISFILFFKNKTLFFTYFFWIVFGQNLFIGFVSFALNEEVFQVAHGINFFFIVLTVFFILIEKPSIILSTTIGLVITTLLIITGLYFIIGLYQYGVFNSSAYLRLFLSPLFLFLIGYYFSSNYVKILDKNIMIFTSLLIFSMIITFFIPNYGLYLFGDIFYYKLKAGEGKDILQYLKRNTFLNIPGMPSVIRTGGIIKSSISAGYFLSYVSFIFLLYKKNIFYIIIFLSLLFFVSSKGAIILFLLILITFHLYSYEFKLKSRFNLAYDINFIFSFIVIGSVITLGYYLNNEHSLGFFNGFQYLFSWGNGLGFSGNLSDIRLQEINGKPLKDLGYFTRFQNGSESALGVLFSSLGIFSLLYLSSYLYIAKKIFSHYVERKIKFVSLLILIGLFQGSFQEEAFSPYALGLVMLIGGVYYPKKGIESSKK